MKLKELSMILHHLNLMMIEINFMELLVEQILQSPLNVIPQHQKHQNQQQIMNIYVQVVN